MKMQIDYRNAKLGPSLKRASVVDRLLAAAIDALVVSAITAPLLLMSYQSMRYGDRYLLSALLVALLALLLDVSGRGSVGKRSLKLLITGVDRIEVSNGGRLLRYFLKYVLPLFITVIMVVDLIEGPAASINNASVQDVSVYPPLLDAGITIFSVFSGLNFLLLFVGSRRPLYDLLSKTDVCRMVK